MKIKSVQYNIVMNFLRVGFGMLSPLIIMPYINRKFDQKLIGEIEYATTIVSYFVLIAGLGVSTYGVREIAKIREDLYKRSKFVLEISIILFFTNLVSYIALFIMLYSNFLKNIDIKIIYLFSLNIFFTSFSFEWFYQGIENQEYITKRSIFIRVISILLILMLVKDKEDSVKYVLILVGTFCFSNLLNLLNLKNYIKIDKNIIENLKIKIHLKNLIFMFGSSIAILIYSQLDIIMIGNIVGPYYVGLYNISIKIIGLGKILITIVGATLLPRLTNFYFSDLNKEYEMYLKKSLQILILYSFCAILFLYINAKEVIYLFGGKEFEEAILTLKLQSVIILFSGLAYFYGVIVLYSQKKDKPFLCSVTAAALINIVLNKVMIYKYNQNGAVLATIVAESFVVLVIYILERREFKKINFLNLNTLKVVIATLIILILEKYLSIRLFNENTNLNIFLKNIYLFSIYIMVLIILREETLINLIKLKRS